MKYNSSLQDLNPRLNFTPLEDRPIPILYNRKPETDVYKDVIKSTSGVKNPTPDFLNSNMVSPGKRDVYKIFLPQRKEVESSHNAYRSDFSPRISQLSRNHVYSSGPTNMGAYAETTKSTTTKMKSSFLPGIAAGPSISQVSSYKSNLISNGEHIVHNGVKMGESTLKREDINGEDRDLTKTLKQSKSDATLMLPESLLRMMADTPVKQKNYHDSLYIPNTLTPGAYNSIYSGNSKEEGIIPPSMYMKGDYSNGLVDELFVSRPRNKSGSFRDKDVLKPIVKTPGSVVGANAITVIDMAGNIGRQRLAERVSLIEGQGSKAYSHDLSGGISERMVPGQFTDTKGKFPKEVFTSNVKKKYFG